MKKQLMKMLFVVLSICCISGLNAQNLIETKNASDAKKCDGVATLTASFKAISWTWKKDSVNVLQKGGTSVDSLCVGQYLLEYTDTLQKLHTVSFAVNVATQPNPCDGFKAFITSVSPNVKNPNNTCNGKIVVTLQGGHKPFNYTWANNVNNKTNVADALCAGTYSGYVKDSNNCIQQFSATVNDTTISNPSNPCDGFKLQVNRIQNNKQGSPNCVGYLEIGTIGGHKPFNFSWTGANAQGPLAQGLCAGKYSITVKDSLNCTATISETVGTDSTSTNPCDGFKVEVVGQKNNFKGSNPCVGFIETKTIGGKAPYSYSWSNGSKDPMAKNLCAGLYILTAKDSNNCSVTLPSVIIGTDSTSTNNCNGFTAFVSYVKPNEKSNNNTCNGIVQVQVQGGKKPYNFTWSTNANNTTNVLDGVCGGNYQGYVKDSLGCTAQFNAFVKDTTINGGGNNNGKPCQVELKGKPTDTTGLNFRLSYVTRVDNNGTVKTYELKIDGKLVSNDTVYLAKMTKGKHIIEYTITTSIGCEDKHIDTMDFPHFDNNGGGTGNCGNFNVFVSKVKPNEKSSAITGCNGIIELAVNGGKAPFNYTWSTLPNNKSNSANGLCGGNYSGYVKDSLGCTAQFNAFVRDTTINGGGNNNGKPCQVELKGKPTDSTGLNFHLSYQTRVDNNGTVKSYELKIDGKVVSTDTAYNAKMTAGKHIIEYAITTSIGCEDRHSDTMSFPYFDGPKVDCKNLSLHVVSLQNNKQGSTNCVGLIQVKADGGKAPFNYHWSNNTTGEIAKGLCPGKYDVEVKDSNNCRTIATFEIKNDSVIGTNPCKDFKVELTKVVNDKKGNAVCSGYIEVRAVGGVAPYNFLWNNGSKTAFVEKACAGTYTVNIKDASNCYATFTQVVTQDTIIINNPCQGFKVELAKVQNDLLGDSICTGRIEVRTFGGLAPFNYTWSNGAQSNVLEKVCAGKYNVIVKDANKCGTELTVEVKADSIPVNVSNCNGFVLNIGGVKNTIKGASNCTGGVYATLAGGKQPYNYYWSNGSKDLFITNVCAGSYSIKAIDANGCITKAEAIVKEDSLANIDKCVSFVANVLVKNDQATSAGGCNGALEASVNGGTAPYTFDWSNGSHDKAIKGLCENKYTLTVTDANKCIIKIDKFVGRDSIIYNPCAAFFANAYVKNDLAGDTICTGIIAVNAGGGKAPFTFKWSDGSSLPYINNVCKGSYTVSIFDQSGCSVTIEKYVGQDSVANPCKDFYAKITGFENSGINAANCNGSLTSTVVGGKAPYDFTWNNGAKSPSVTGLCPGEYTVEIKDANKCSVTLTGKVFVDTTKNLCDGFYTKVITVINDKAGDNLCTGSIITETFGGKTPYTYLWSNNETSKDLKNICAGKYFLNVKDANNCIFVLDKGVGTDADIDTCKGFYAAITNIVDDSEDNATCLGKLEVTAKGGVAPYSYVWSNGDTVSVAHNLCADGYKVSVKDSKGCEVTLNAKVRKTPSKKSTLVAKVHTADATSAANCDGAMKIEIISGNAPYAFYHSNGEVGQYRTNICPGVYTVYVKDAKGQVLELTYLISAPTNSIKNDKPALKDSIVKDTVKASITKDCSINYNAIDSVKIKEYKLLKADSVLVTWAVFSGNTVVYVTDIYVFTKGKGVYSLKLDLYCNEQKEIGNFLSASESLLFAAESTTASIVDKTIENVSVYPNPFNDKFTIKLDKVQNYTIHVIDLSGKTLNSNVYTNTNSINMDLGHLAEGQYILKIVSDNTSITRMISK